jgi:hypothetical protein
MSKVRPEPAAVLVSGRRFIAFVLGASGAYSIAAGMMLTLSRGEVPPNSLHTVLTFEERVGHQRAIEEVYWRHRIWPKESARPKPSLDAVMSQAELEKKVADNLWNSEALEDYWQHPITAEQLQKGKRGQSLLLTLVVDLC